MPLILARADPISASIYPASVIAKSLQSVWDLRLGGSTTVGIRSATTKTLGVDSLSGTGFSYDGRFLTTTGNGAALSGWNLATIASNGYVETSHTATFTDCNFGFHPSTIVGYSLSVASSTTTCSYCTFDGDRLNNAFVSSPFNVNSGATLNTDHCDIVDQPSDGGKSNGTLICLWNRWQNWAWYSGADGDGIQAGAGVVDVQHCLFDVRDGSSLGDSYPGAPINNFFRAESFAGAITGVTFKNNICTGILGYGSIPGAYVSISAMDVNPNPITNVLYQDNVIQKGHALYTYADGSTRAPHLTSDQWVGNIDYDTSATIAVP